MGEWDGHMKERAQLRNLWLDVVCRHGSRNAIVDEHGNVLAQFKQLHTSAEEFAKANQNAGCCSSTDGNRRAIGLGKLIHPLEIVVARLGCLIGGLVWTMEDKDLVIPPPGTTGDDLLYIMCTSGTSTFPKKIKGSAAATLNRVVWFWSTFPLMPGGDVAIARTHPKFVDSVAEVFQALLSGVMIVLPCTMGSLDDPVSLLAAVLRFQVTLFTTTPSLLRLVLDVVQDCSKSIRLPTCLRLVCVSGEPLPMEIVRSFAKIRKLSNLKNLELVNLYGSTETTGDVSYCTMTEMLMQHPTEELFASIGHPISGVRFHIIPVQNSSPLMEHSGHQYFNVGELIVTGVGLSIGYCCNSSADRCLDEKECAFLNVNNCEVLLGENHERAYRTGDLVMKGEHGLFFWRGRLDSQVSRRGVNVCLEKMECVAKYATQAKQVKMAIHYECGEQRLFCFVSAPQPVSWLSLRIRKALPPVCTPSEVVKVNDAFTWPLTTSGKIDRSELLQYWLQNRSEVQEEECFSGDYDNRRAIEMANQQPVVERVLRGVVTAILETRSLHLSKKASNMLNIWAQRSLPTSVELSFGDLGGDSLSAIEAAWRIRKAPFSFEGLLPEHLLNGSLDNALEAGRGRHGGGDSSKRKRKWSILSDLVACEQQHHSTVEECSTKEEIMDPCLPQRHTDVIQIATNGKGSSFPLHSKSEMSNHGSNRKILMDPLWNIPLRACVDATPAVLQRENGEVLAFVGSHGGDLVCIDIRTGTVQWTADLGSTRVEVAVTLSNNNTMVFVGCYDGRLISLDTSSGVVNWSWATNDAIRCPPVSCILNFSSRIPALLVGSYARTIDCLKQSNGYLIWRYRTEGQVAASPVYLNEVIYIATTASPSLVALCEKAGEVLWTCTSLSAPVFANMIASSNGKAIICASFDGTVHAVSAGESEGELLWKVQPGGGIWGGVAFNVNRGCQQVIVAGHDDTKTSKGMVCMINFETGNITWKLQLEGKVYGSCFVLEGCVFIAQTDGLLLAIDIVDGTVVSSLKLLRSGLETFSSPVLVPGPGIDQQHQQALLFIGSRQDALHCVSVTGI